MKKTLLIITGLCISIFANICRSNDTVIDTKTGLQWQDDGVGTKTTWRNALDRCENLTLGGYSDWRLANKNELLSIVDYSRSFPAINRAFTNTAYGNGSLYDDVHYWSSSTYIGAHYQTRRPTYDSAWSVPFATGFSYGRGKNKSYYVRCVRSGK